MSREFCPNVVVFPDESTYQEVTGYHRGVAARHQDLTPGRVYGAALEFASMAPDERPAQFEDFLQFRLER